MNEFNVKLLACSDLIEEEVVVLVNDIELTCFASICPYPIKVGCDYKVIMELVVFDDLKIEKCKRTDPKMKRIADTFAYELIGVLSGNTLNVGIDFLDDELFEDCFQFDGQMVKLHVDRIDIEFL